MIKTFRGMMSNADIDRIRLGTNNGLTGYRIKKFEALAYYPSGSSPEAILKLFTVKPPTEPDGTPTGSDTINFESPTLLAALFYEGNSNDYYTTQTVTLFDNMTFNQDIYITCYSTDNKINYYIELEQVPLSKDEATVATLKDMRGRE